MLLLRANTDDLELVTGAAAAHDIEVHLSAMQADASTPPVVQPAPNLGPAASITSATTTQILDTSGITSGHIVNVKDCSIYNNHASNSCVVTVQVNDGTNVTVKKKVTLLAGESLDLTQGGVWLHYDSNGAVYPSVGNAASQAEMEAGTATDKFVTPQGVNWHPGVAKCWLKANGAGTSLLANWNITSISDTGTGRLGITIGTDFSDANWVGLTSIQRVATSLAVASVDNGGNFRNVSQTAGVIEVENYDDTATTHVAQDPEYYFFAGFGDQA
jgi:hypothetical protein